MKGLVYKYNAFVQSVPAVAHRQGIARSAPFLGKFVFTNQSLRTIDISRAAGSVMDATRYDRNADLISQIMFHIDKLWVKPNTIEAHLKLEMVAALHRALNCNDKLGKLTEKGLI